MTQFEGIIFCIMTQFEGNYFFTVFSPIFPGTASVAKHDLWTKISPAVFTAVSQQLDAQLQSRPWEAQGPVGPGPEPGPESQSLQGCTALGPWGPKASAHYGPESMRTWGLGPWIMGPWLPVFGLPPS